jgi:hypothetical protein
MIDAQPTYPQLALNIQPQGLTVSVLAAPNIITSQVMIDPGTMREIVRQWLKSDEELMNELVREQVAARKNQLAIIKHVRETRVN